MLKPIRSVLTAAAFCVTAACEMPPAQTYHAEVFTLNWHGASKSVKGASVKPAFFSAAKIRPLIGRVFLPADVEHGVPRLAVLSYRLWQGMLGSDPRSIGTTVELNQQDFTIVGIMPKDFNKPSDSDVWTPMAE